jgi:hypothetical protein
MALGLFLGITGMSAYAGCFGERDGIPKRIKNEEQDCSAGVAHEGDGDDGTPP